MAGFGEKLLSLIGLEKTEPVEDERMGFGYNYNKGGRKHERRYTYEDNVDMRGYSDDDYNEDYSEFEDDPYSRNTGKVSGIPDTSKLRVIIYRPVSYDDSQEIINQLKDKRTLVINLDELETDVAQRILDFISGAVYALSGNIRKAARNLFVVTPYNVDVTTNMMDGMDGEDDFEYNYFDRE